MKFSKRVEYPWSNALVVPGDFVKKKYLFALCTGILYPTPWSMEPPNAYNLQYLVTVFPLLYNSDGKGFYQPTE